MTSKEKIEKECAKSRLAVKELSKDVLKLKSLPFITHELEEFNGQHSEMCANVMLAYRHLEDARMRIGKVMQQIQGGVSKYDADEEASIK